MLSEEDLKIFDKLRDIMKNEDKDILRSGLICELYAQGFRDGDDFHYSSQGWDDIITSNPNIIKIVERWINLEN